MGYMEEHFSTLSSTMLAITQFQAVDTPRFTHSKILKCEILHMDKGALPPTTPVNPYLGHRAQKNGPLFKSLGPFLVISEICHFLGGLSLHLNHLIASRMANYDWPFGTLPFGLFGSNLDTMDLETYPRTYSGHF